jgi:transcriptional regulator with GAF, ATPase, and Fis domain
MAEPLHTSFCGYTSDRSVGKFDSTMEKYRSEGVLMVSAEPGSLHHRIADLARSLHSSEPNQTDDALQRMVEYAAHEIPGARYAGITVVNAHGEVTTPAATHRYPALLDEIQERYGEGPCLSAAWRQHTERIDDLPADGRWPLYQRDAVKATPIKSVLSFRLFTSKSTIGALNVFANQAYAFDEEAEELGYVLATHTALALDTVRREDHFRSALASRDLIGQAKGILMARLGITALQAFELLKRLSQETNTKLVDVARKVTTTDGIGDL